MQEQNITEVEKTISPGFQSVHQDGARNRDQEIELIKELNLGQYNLSDFTVTQNGPVIVTTNLVSADETIDGEHLSGGTAPRLDVFLKTDSGWQWIAHANLTSLEQ